MKAKLVNEELNILRGPSEEEISKRISGLPVIYENDSFKIIVIDDMGYGNFALAIQTPKGILETGISHSGQNPEQINVFGSPGNTPQAACLGPWPPR